MIWDHLGPTLFTPQGGTIWDPHVGEGIYDLPHSCTGEVQKILLLRPAIQAYLAELIISIFSGSASSHLPARLVRTSEMAWKET